MNVEIDFLEMVHGIEKTLFFHKKCACDKCDGEQGIFKGIKSRNESRLQKLQRKRVYKK